MLRDTRDVVDHVLQNVKSSRREVLKRLLIGAGAAALLVPMSTVLASAQTGESTGKGKGKGKAKGKGKGKGKGTGKGKGKGKGKGQGPGAGD